MVTVLTHTTCPVTGQILRPWGGWYGRFGVTLNSGWTERDGLVTAEDLVNRWEQIVDEDLSRRRARCFRARHESAAGNQG